MGFVLRNRRSHGNGKHFIYLLVDYGMEITMQKEISSGKNELYLVVFLFLIN